MWRPFSVEVLHYPGLETEAAYACAPCTTNHSHAQCLGALARYWSLASSRWDASGIWHMELWWHHSVVATVWTKAHIGTNGTGGVDCARMADTLTSMWWRERGGCAEREQRSRYGWRCLAWSGCCGCGT